MLNKEEQVLLDAIVVFDTKANELIRVLADVFDLNLNQKHPFGKLITRSNNLWKGSVNANWTYQFHGDACKFENTTSKQMLDVKINRNGNYGAINNFYLLKFIETTDSLHYVLSDITYPELLHKALIALEAKNFIVDLGKFPFSTKVLNKEKLKEVAYSMPDKV